MLAFALALALPLAAAPNPMGDFQAARAAEQAGDAAAAGRLLEQVCLEAPSWALARIELAQVRLAQGDAAQARGLASQAVQLDATSPRGWHVLSLADEAAADLPGAIDADQHALALRPGYAEAEDHLARVEWNAGRHADAIELYLHIVEERPNEVGPLALLASAEEEDGRLEAAEQALRTLVAIEPTSAGWHRRLGRLLQQEGKERDAAQELAKADRLVGEKRQQRHLRPLLPSRR